MLPRILSLLLLLWLSCCAGRPPAIISDSASFTKQQPDYANSDDFRKRLGKKIFDHERARRGFNPKKLTESDEPRPLASLVAERALSPDEEGSLHDAGIDSYNLFWQDLWWGRTYWFYFFYRNGNSFSYDVYTKTKKNAVIYD